jgi:predicted DCC family thiol-disulfide oxidoreductase YuxK
VRAVPFQQPGALYGLPAIPRAALESAMQLVSPSGEVCAGAAALPALLRLLPMGSPVAALFRIPGVPALAARVYAAVARNRHRLGCGSTVCRRGR